jgi:hypothetical protein
VGRICGWAEANIEKVQEARAAYDTASQDIRLSA